MLSKIQREPLTKLHLFLKLLIKANYVLSIVTKI